MPSTIVMYENVKRVMRLINGANLVKVGIAIMVVSWPIKSTLAVYATSTTIQDMVISTSRWLLPAAQFERSTHDLIVSVSEVGAVDQIKILVTYSHLVDGLQVEEALTASFTKNTSEETMVLPPITIGTCSFDSCVPHEGVEEMEIEVQFMNQGIQVHEVTSLFNF